MKILTAEYIKSAPSLKECPDFGGMPEIVLVGRSNVGKSSFINSMTWRKNLARTSNTPGKTRYINFYKIAYEAEGSGESITAREGVGEATQPLPEGPMDAGSPKGGTAPEQKLARNPQTLIFVDLPGYGYAKVSKTEQEQWRRNLEAYLQKRDPIALVIQLIDARHGPQENDIRMFEWLQHHGRQVQIILTKTDKLSRNEAASHLAGTARALDTTQADIILYSAENHQGRELAWGKILNICSAVLPT